MTLFALAENTHTASPCFTCDFADMMYALEQDLGLHCSPDDGSKTTTLTTLLPPCGQYRKVHLISEDICVA